MSSVSCRDSGVGRTWGWRGRAENAGLVFVVRSVFVHVRIPSLCLPRLDSSNRNAPSALRPLALAPDRDVRIARRLQPQILILNPTDMPTFFPPLLVIITGEYSQEGIQSEGRDNI